MLCLHVYVCVHALCVLGAHGGESIESSLTVVIDSSELLCGW